MRANINEINLKVQEPESVQKVIVLYARQNGFVANKIQNDNDPVIIQYGTAMGIANHCGKCLIGIYHYIGLDIESTKILSDTILEIVQNTSADKENINNEIVQNKTLASPSSSNTDYSESMEQDHDELTCKEMERLKANKAVVNNNEDIKIFDDDL
ncbi:hypothetical protein RCL_jg7918.t1 [Rhizophagus clarus]|uniref:Uncharacterized protein n=1 Tax=Rhizophagus clarus TaxID=94130 RepID=A0A8H3MED5_9GLOM|nr:hypothetical protein RCL_jg7918.t1 [Rhizophagus clarus]